MALVALTITPFAPASAEPTQSYIVVLEPGLPTDAARLAERAAQHVGGAVDLMYEDAVQGFAITMPPAAAARVAELPFVAYVEPDRRMSIAAQAISTGIARIDAPASAAIDIDGTDDRRVDVDIAVIDTGIDRGHPDLNVVGGVTCVAESGGITAACVPGGDDNHYHGTHMAGIIGAIDNGIGVVGVAPGARLWAVKAFDDVGQGTLARILAAIDWVAANAATIEVANMSFVGVGHSQALYDAMQSLLDAGVAVAVAAGNEGADARLYSPASFDNVLTVSALADFDGRPGGSGAPTCMPDQDDTLADFSNRGAAIDMAAPGVCIRSTVPQARGGYGTLSGTSMATPHVAGGLALLASADPPRSASDVAALYQRVLSAGNLDWVDDSGDGVHERLLNVRTFQPRLIDVPTWEVVRLSGPDRYATSVAVSLDGYAPGVAAAYVASGQDYPDALTAGPAGGPVLLVQPTAVPAAVLAELRRLAPERIVIAGGPAAVSAAVELQLAGIAPVVRAAGPDRYATAAAVSRLSHPGGSGIAYLATGSDYPDALAAGPAAARRGAPLLLTTGDRLHGEAAAELARLGVRDVVVAGGPGAVSSAVEARLKQLGYAVTRAAGPDRYATATALSKQVFGAGTAAQVYLATGRDFPDALGAGAAAAGRGAPLLLSNTTCMPTTSREEIRRTGADTVRISGGTAVLSDAAAHGMPC